MARIHWDDGRVKIGRGRVTACGRKAHSAPMSKEREAVTCLQCKYHITLTDRFSRQASAPNHGAGR